jgi:replicative superfamily II helicase
MNGGRNEKIYKSQCLLYLQISFLTYIKTLTMKAVLSADLVGFTKLDPRRAHEVIGKLKAFIDEIEGQQIKSNVAYNFQIKRGDSIQGQINDVSRALEIGLLFKAAVTQMALGSQIRRRHPDIDIRLAIGLGEIEEANSGLVNEAFGEAYVNSGRTLDRMKKERRLFSIKTPVAEWDRELDTQCRLLEAVLSGWNIASAELIYWLIMGYTEIEIAKKLNISQSAVNQRKKRAGWSGIEAMNTRFKELTRNS